MQYHCQQLLYVRMCVCAHPTAIIQIITIILAVWTQAEWGEVV